MVPITVEKFADMVMKNNEGTTERVDQNPPSIVGRQKVCSQVRDLRPAHLGGGQRYHRHRYMLHLHNGRGG